MVCIAWSALISPVLNNILFDRSKFKVLADDKIDEHKNRTSFLELVENIVRKGENAGYQCYEPGVIRK